MSYYVTKKITCNAKTGKLSVTVADSSIYPRTFRTCEYMDQEADFSKRVIALISSIYDGNFHLRRSANEKFSEALSCMNGWVSEVSEDFFKSASMYQDYSMYIKVKEALAALAYQVCFKGEKKDIRKEISVLREKNREWLAKKKKEWEEQGYISICTALRSSVFPGYDVLIDSEERLILAPKEDYQRGILKTEREIVFEDPGEDWFYLLADGKDSRPDDYEAFEAAVCEKTKHLKMEKLPYPSFPVDSYIKITGKDRGEFLGQIIDVFEDMLVKITGSEESVIFQGPDYDAAAAALSNLLLRWQTDRGTIWLEHQTHIENTEDSYHMKDVIDWLNDKQEDQCRMDGFSSAEQIRELAEEIISVNRHAEDHYGCDPEWLYSPDGLSDAYAETVGSLKGSERA